MNIEANIIKHYLKNCYFIVGTAYAGKSTMCKGLAKEFGKEFGMYHCEENYNSETIFKVIDIEKQPNLSYFKTKASWSEFVNRRPDEYQRWTNGNNEELIGFEISELIRASKDKNVIVDTNIPINVLTKIADYNQIAVMLSPPEISLRRFFDRDDSEKQFLLKEINKCDDPDKTYINFKTCIKKVNESEYKKYLECALFTINRGFSKWLSKKETLNILSNHFKLSKKQSS